MTTDLDKMKKNRNSIGLILGYNSFYNDTPPSDRLELLKGISKIDLITELLASNFRIKPPLKIFFDYSIDTQCKELNYHLRLNPTVNKIVIARYISLLENHNSNSVLFNRASFLFAINELLATDKLSDQKKFNFNGLQQENIFKYLLLVNDRITLYQDSLSKESDYSQIERLNIALLSLNEYFYPIDPILTLYRGGSLLTYLLNTAIKDRLEAYIRESVDMEPHQYVYELAGINMTRHMGKGGPNFFFELEQSDTRIKFFDYLSQRNKAESKYELEFLDLKKSPFIKHSERTFLLIDNMFILSKSYDFLINEFLFDCLLKNTTQEKERETILKDFKSYIGLFFESHLKAILSNAFSNTRYTIRSFNELKIKVEKKEIEIADIYIRSKNKVILGQAKSTSIVNREKYSEDIEEFYNGRPDNFFKRHGLLQLVESIKNLIEFGSQIDHQLQKDRLKIFPVLIFNDFLLNHLLFPKVFNEKFNQLISSLQNHNVKIYPLTTIHIADLEILENQFRSKNLKIFPILKKYHKTYNLTKPFYWIANKTVPRKYPDRAIAFLRELSTKFGKK